MRGLEQKQKGENEIDFDEKMKILQSKTRAIEIVHEVKLKLIGDCHDRGCRSRYDLTADFLSRKNGAASFAKNCYTANPLGKGPKRISPIFDGRLCWQELRYWIEGEDRQGEKIFVQFWKVKQLRERLLQYIDWKPEKIKQEHPDIFYSVILNYGNLVESFRDIRQKYKMKWVNYDEIVEKLLAAGLLDCYISWITGLCANKIERRKKNNKKTT